MTFLKSSTPERGIEDLSERIVKELNSGKRVLWLVSGGSNISISAKVMGNIKRDVPRNALGNLTVALVDERYGKEGHKDSNWKQLIDAGFGFDGISSIPVLKGMSLEETVAKFQQNIRKAFKKSGYVIAQIGMGSDGHMAGILPGSVAIESEQDVCAYESAPYTRITITPRFLKEIGTAYVFAFGESKMKVVSDLRTHYLKCERAGTVPSDKEIAVNPSLLLIKLSEVYFYSDQIA